MAKQPHFLIEPRREDERFYLNYFSFNGADNIDNIYMYRIMYFEVNVPCIFQNKNNSGLFDKIVQLGYDPVCKIIILSLKIEFFLLSMPKRDIISNSSSTNIT